MSVHLKTLQINDFKCLKGHTISIESSGLYYGRLVCYVCESKKDRQAKKSARKAASEPGGGRLAALELHAQLTNEKLREIIDMLNLRTQDCERANAKIALLEAWALQK